MKLFQIILPLATLFQTKELTVQVSYNGSYELRTELSGMGVVQCSGKTKQELYDEVEACLRSMAASPSVPKIGLCVISEYLLNASAYLDALDSYMEEQTSNTEQEVSGCLSHSRTTPSNPFAQHSPYEPKPNKQPSADQDDDFYQTPFGKVRILKGSPENFLPVLMNILGQYSEEDLEEQSQPTPKRYS